MRKVLQNVLECSMRLDKSPYRFARILGKVTGVVPVWYAERLERKLFHKKRRNRRSKKRK
jgi:hypothetical protein